MHADCKQLPYAAKRRSTKQPPCSAIGRCICSPPYNKTFEIRNAFHAITKRLCPKESDAHALLLVRKLFVRLECWPPELDYWSAALADLAADGRYEKRVLWWHIGAHSMKPYRFCFRSMSCANDAPDDNGLVTLEVNIKKCI